MEPESSTMIIRDDVHDEIPIPDYIQCVIRTKYFQRLKNIKQLGLSYLVKNSANHTRYQHCIGTYYCAEQMLKALEKNTEKDDKNPDGLKIAEFFWNAVTTAALLHDVGHGPFSHLWEHLTSNKLSKSPYNHEAESKDCCNHIFNCISPKWMMIEGDESKAYAIELVKSFISGNHSVMKTEDKKKYLFLYDIINNIHCGLDVDKWDYLKRDYIRLSSKSSDDQLEVPVIDDDVMNFKDVFLKARVRADRKRIEYRYCDYGKIYNIFKARAELTKHVYGCPLVVCLEQVFDHIISEVGDQLKIDGKNITEIRVADNGAFLKLDNNKVWNLLENIKSPDNIVKLIKCLAEAKISATTAKNVPKYLRVSIEIDNAGTFMNKKCSEEKLFFYGNVKDMPLVDREMGVYTASSNFQITE